METPTTSETVSDTPVPRRWTLPTTAGFWSGFVFVLAACTAVVRIRQENIHRWFYLDDWSFLAGRDAGSVTGLLDDHNGHWVSVPVVVYRMIFSVVGLRSYLPYQAVAIAVHVVVASLILILARRAGADPWVASAAATLFVFFGAGRSNFGWAFQITFTGALAFGLAFIWAVDRDGNWSHRDVAALVLGVLAMACSAPGVAMVAGGVLTAWLRRGWRTAAAFAVPLVVLFGAWYLPFGSGSTQPGPASLGGVLRYAGQMVGNVPVRVSGGAWGGIVLVVLVVAGGLVAKRRELLQVRGAHASLAGMLAAAGGLVALTSISRSGAAELLRPTEGRYLYLLAALVLPTIAVSLSVLPLGWARGPSHRLAPVMALVLLVGLPANASSLGPQGGERFVAGDQRGWTQLAALAMTGDFPDDAHPSPLEAPDVTIAWLRKRVQDGDLVPAPSVDPTVRANATLAMQFLPAERRREECRVVADGVTFTVETGDQIQANASALSLAQASEEGSEATATFLGDPTVALKVEYGPLALTASFPVGEASPLEVCPR